MVVVMTFKRKIQNDYERLKKYRRTSYINVVLREVIKKENVFYSFLFSKHKISSLLVKIGDKKVLIRSTYLSPETINFIKECGRELEPIRIILAS